MKKVRRTDLVIALTITLLAMLATVTGFNRNIELIGYDLGVRFSSTKSANQDVVIVKIDEASLQAKGGWPWPRDILAQATRIMAAARPAVIGFALPLDREQNAYGLEYIQKLKTLVQDESDDKYTEIKGLLRKAEISMDTDQDFANSLNRGGRIVMAIPFIESDKSKPSQNGLASYAQKYTLKNVKGIESFQSDWKKWLLPEPVLSIDKVYPPIKTLVRQAGGAGTLYLGTDESNVRAEPLVLKYGNDYLPSFVLMMAARSKALSADDIQVDLKQQRVTLGKNELKVDNQLRIYPRFYHPKKEKEIDKAFIEYSMLDLLNGKVSHSALRNKTILVGITAPQHALPQRTPGGTMMSPVNVVAHKISSLFNDDLYVLPAWAIFAQLSVLLLLGFYLFFLLPRFRLGTGMAMSALLLILLLNVHFVAMISQSLWLPLVTPVLVLVIGHFILATKTFIDSHLLSMKIELSQANLMIAQSLHAQGNLDQAMEKYRKCLVDEALLEQMYNLGLDYERKRQFNKAIPVFETVKEHDSLFRDVLERIVRNKEATNAILGSGNKQSETQTLVATDPAMEKPMLGRYQVDKELGRGAMGMVYLGHDPKIGRTVAIKTMKLSQEFDGDKLAEVKERFFREAETAGCLNHPNIVTIYDVGEDQDMSYIAMDYLKGVDLVAYANKETLLPLNEVLDVIVKVANALDYAHKQKVVHRDVKPANIIYDKETGILKVTDFGIACLTDTSKTKTGTILGSPSYMSPEQIAGKRVDGRSDLYSLGVMMFQLLTGELPFKGESLATLMFKITSERHPDIRTLRSDLPLWISKFIDKALEKDIEKRFQTGQQVSDVISRYRNKD